tara:strand:- start:130 stop:438 length:309 start_codon:yes stop_codon:yes gene_type:complete
MTKETNIKEKLEKLIQAGLQAYDLLVAEIKRPIADDLQDDRTRNAMKAKRECFADAREILKDIAEIEAQLQGKEIENEVKEDNPFAASFAEQFATKSKKDRK